MQPKASPHFCKSDHPCGKANNIRGSRQTSSLVHRNAVAFRCDSTRYRPRSAQRLRAWAACGAILAWFFGLELLPNLHLWRHDPAGHNHDSGGTMVTVRFGPDVELSPHRHRDGGFHDPLATQSHHQARASARHHYHQANTTVQAPNRDQNRHVATGLAHRATAIAAAPAMLPLPVRSVLRDVEIALRTSTTLYAMDALAPSARGPPTKPDRSVS